MAAGARVANLADVTCAAGAAPALVLRVEVALAAHDDAGIDPLVGTGRHEGGDTDDKACGLHRPSFVCDAQEVVIRASSASESESREE